MKKCSVESCNKLAKSPYGGMCGMHAQRKRRGQPLEAKTRYDFQVCTADGCDKRQHVTHNKSVNVYGYCLLHLNRMRNHGHIEQTRQPRYRGRHKDMEGYIMVFHNWKYQYEHIVLAEKALGKKLPKGARVHHMNEIRDDNHTPFNLVVCPNQSYHALLHKRMRELNK